MGVGMGVGGRGRGVRVAAARQRWQHGFSSLPGKPTAKARGVVNHQHGWQHGTGVRQAVMLQCTCAWHSAQPAACCT